MPVFKCNVEITAHAVTSPGTWLARRDEIYLRISLFGQSNRTTFRSPAFPLVFNDRFLFDKTFYSCYGVDEVNESLTTDSILIELCQAAGLYAGDYGDTVLASYRGNVRDFLYPFYTYSAEYGTDHREIVLDRHLDFPGINPRFEFSTNILITRTSSLDVDIPVYTPRSVLRSRSPSPMYRSTSRGRVRTRSLSAGRLRARSASAGRTPRGSSPVRRSVSPYTASNVPLVYSPRYYDDYSLTRPRTAIASLERTLDDLSLSRTRYGAYGSPYWYSSQYGTTYNGHGTYYRTPYYDTNPYTGLYL